MGSGTIENCVIEFFGELFDAVFTEPFRGEIDSFRRRREVAREIEGIGDIASSAVQRYFLNAGISETRAKTILEGLRPLAKHLTAELVSNPNASAESIAQDLLVELPYPADVRLDELEGAYRVTLEKTLQSVLLVGPILAEWRSLKFARTFEAPQRITEGLRSIAERMDALAGPGGRSGDAEELFELEYRDYLLQRFYRIEAGTVRMATNLFVDLRELFVMPGLRRRPDVPEDEACDEGAEALLDLAAARKALGGRGDVFGNDDEDTDGKPDPAFDLLRPEERAVVIGAPGSGKSTLFEWLQIQIAGAEEELILGGAQAIPLLLRVRALNPDDLPKGRDLIATATSRDTAEGAPDGWIERKLSDGRILLMLDGLDEVEPTVRDDVLVPWFLGLVGDYPDCRYLVSSRPVGYPPRTLHESAFAEFDLQDFRGPEIEAYTRQWCTAAHLAKNLPEKEARTQGEKDGAGIVTDFRDQPHIADLARNPLMLSAICLVYYFENGTLPKDRALLYKLCVEGLLHNWDQRRGITSDFALADKLRVCREVAIRMQAADRAEAPADEVCAIMAEVLGDEARAERLMQHIRQRSGLLIERRADVFAFAHLTFQEYLAACAVHEGNRTGVKPDRLMREWNDGRWREVIPLHCGVATAASARNMITALLDLQLDWREERRMMPIVADGLLASPPDVSDDPKLRTDIIRRLTLLPGTRTDLNNFDGAEVARIATETIGRQLPAAGLGVSAGEHWVLDNSQFVDDEAICNRLLSGDIERDVSLTILFVVAHRMGSASTLGRIRDAGLLDRGRLTPGGVGFATTELLRRDDAPTGAAAHLVFLLRALELRPPATVIGPRRTWNVLVKAWIHRHDIGEHREELLELAQRIDERSEREGANP